MITSSRIIFVFVALNGACISSPRRRQRQRRRCVRSRTMPIAPMNCTRNNNNSHKNSIRFDSIRGGSLVAQTFDFRLFVCVLCALAIAGQCVGVKWHDGGRSTEKESHELHDIGISNVFALGTCAACSRFFDIWFTLTSSTVKSIGMSAATETGKSIYEQTTQFSCKNSFSKKEKEHGIALQTDRGLRTMSWQWLYYRS